MEKMKLEMDEIEVASFEVAEPERQDADGTVYGKTTVDACIPTIVRPVTCDC